MVVWLILPLIPFVVAVKARLGEAAAKNNPELIATRAEVQRLRVECESAESKLGGLRREQANALDELKREFRQEVNLRSVVAAILSPANTLEMARTNMAQFQEDLPSRCRVNPDLVTFKHCESLHMETLDKLEASAQEVVTRAELNTQGGFEAL